MVPFEKGQKLLRDRYTLIKQKTLFDARSESWLALDNDEYDYLIRLWPFDSETPDDLQRALWDNELRTIYRLGSSPGAEEFLLVIWDAGIDLAARCFVMVLKAPGYRFTGYNMLTKLILEHFKCFEKLHLALAPLTLLSGANATGKSTILQSLAILNQTSVEREWSKTLIFNASNTGLGSAADIIDKLTGQKTFKIGLHSHSFECLWTMKATDRLSLSAPIENISWREDGNNWEEKIYNVKENNIHHLLPSTILESSENAKYLSDVISNLTYISADRLGPRETYSATTPDLYKTVGSRGERTAWFLHHFEDRTPPESLVLKDFPPILQRQTEAWMRFFFPGTSFEIKPVSNANLITIGIRTSDATNFHRPQNVGYGLSSVLPIFAACLGAKPGDLVMAENPEAHLSPSGQSKMGIFLARTAVAGIQVMLETHSDHVLNGVRRAVKEKMIDEESVSIHFFIPRKQKDDSQVISPIMKKDGNLDSWPDGFFDQLDKDLAFLIGWEE